MVGRVVIYGDGITFQWAGNGRIINGLDNFLMKKPSLKGDFHGFPIAMFDCRRNASCCCMDRYVVGNGLVVGNVYALRSSIS